MQRLPLMLLLWFLNLVMVKHIPASPGNQLLFSRFLFFYTSSISPMLPY
jgi:hypothetical protein